MSGTRVVEPGQGASVEQLFQVFEMREQPLIGASAAWNHIVSIQNAQPPGHGLIYRTNLALTGQPLTAEDVQNIGRAK